MVVTHNKGTMAACQMLYGVTMAVRGVSHVVSVELDEVDEIVPAARGGSGAKPALEGTAPEATAGESPPPAAGETKEEDEVPVAVPDGGPVHGPESGDLVPAS